MKTKIILIVGASSGFGELAARKLLNLGHTVYAAARRVDRMAELEALGAKLIAMDVTDHEMVQAGVQQIIDEQGRIDVVFANAGYGSYGTIESIPMRELTYQYDVNVFGVVRTLKAVLPHMREQRDGRIIITSSLAGHLSGACLGWYASTKHAITGMAEALRQETRHLGIEVVLIEPGAVQTEFEAIAFEAMENVDHEEDYTELVDGFRASMTKNYAKSPGPESTANAMVKAATVRRPKTCYRTTTDAKIFPRIRNLVNDRLYDRIFLRELFKSLKK